MDGREVEVRGRGEEEREHVIKDSTEAADSRRHRTGAQEWRVEICHYLFCSGKRGTGRERWGAAEVDLIRCLRAYTNTGACTCERRACTCYTWKPYTLTQGAYTWARGEANTTMRKRSMLIRSTKEREDTHAAPRSERT